MDFGDKRLSASLASVEFIPDGEGTRMLYTEQMTIFDGADNGDDRRIGTEGHFDRLLQVLES